MKRTAMIRDLSFGEYVNGGPGGAPQPRFAPKRRKVLSALPPPAEIVLDSEWWLRSLDFLPSLADLDVPEQENLDWANILCVSPALGSCCLEATPEPRWEDCATGPKGPTSDDLFCERMTEIDCKVRACAGASKRRQVVSAEPEPSQFLADDTGSIESQQQSESESSLGDKTLLASMLSADAARDPSAGAISFDVAHITSPEPFQPASQQQQQTDTATEASVSDVASQVPVGRKAHSLGDLCERFLRVASSQRTETFELDGVIKQLGVARRRLYDIVNILEGAGLLERRGRNMITWLGCGAARSKLARLRAADTGAEHESRRFAHCSLVGQVERFLKLFRLRRVISWNAALHELNAQLGAEEEEFKPRRLYDVSNVLAAVQIIRKERVEGMRKPMFRWAGIGKGNSVLGPLAMRKRKRQQLTA